MLTLILKGMIEGKNWKGKQRMSYMEQIMKDIECIFSEMKKLADKREKWRHAANS